MGKGYPKKGGGARAVGAIGGKLEEIAREGAQRLLAEMLELEVEEFLQRARYERGQMFRGYRNGHAAERVLAPAYAGAGEGAHAARESCSYRGGFPGL